MVDELVEEEAQDAGSPPAGEDAPALGTSGASKRIDELTKKRREAEREASYWRGVAESRVTPPQPSTPPKVLDPDDFDSNADYLKAVADSLRADIKAAKESDEAARQATAVKEMVSKARGKYKDFDEVARNPSVPITKEMYEAAMGENLGDVLYYLGSNVEEASRIASLPPTQQVKEIGRVEDRLKAPPGKTTNAPAPPSVLKGGGSSPPGKDESKMTRAELHAKWEADRRKEMGL